MLHTTRRLVILALADEQLHSRVQPLLTIVARRIVTVTDANTLLLSVWEHSPDLIVLEAPAQRLAVPALCRQLRQYFQTAILVVEEGASEQERIAWLDSGADDVLSLHCATPAELPARCHALVRRLRRQQRRDPTALRLHSLGLQLDIAGRRLYLTEGQVIDLSTSLTRFLAIFFSYGDAFVPTEVLGQHMFGGSPANLPKRLYAMIQTLHQRMASATGLVPCVERIRGQGYRLNLAAPAVLPASPGPAASPDRHDDSYTAAEPTAE